MAATTYDTVPAGGRSTVDFLHAKTQLFFPCPSKPELLIFLMHTNPVANNV